MEILKHISDLDKKRLNRLKEQHKKLHLMSIPICKMKAQVLDKRNKVSVSYEDLSRSWNRNFYNWQVCQQMTCSSNCMGSAFGEGTLACKDKDGNPGSSNTPHHLRTASQGYQENSGGLLHGIIVGTGSTPESFEDYYLESVIEEGTGAGQLNYSAVSPIVPVYDPVTKELKAEVIRYMLNNSGGTIGVNEVGLMVCLSGMYYTMISRDVLPSTLNVLADYQLKVTYEITITYPA